jgi:hypothetical protein
LYTSHEPVTAIGGTDDLFADAVFFNEAAGAGILVLE